MKLILRIVSGSKYGQMIVVEPHQVRTIGRSTAAEYTFDDETMSGTHLEVENLGEQGALVRDRNSRNRTWLNKQPVTTAALKHGDSLRAGKTVFSIEFAGSSSSAYSPAAIASPPGIVPPPVATPRNIVPPPVALPPSNLPSPVAPPPPVAKVEKVPIPDYPRSYVPAELVPQPNEIPVASSGAPDAAEPSEPEFEYQTPISDSVSWAPQQPNPESMSIIDERRFRQFERVGDFQTVFNLRTIISSLKSKKNVRVIVHFPKICMLNPQLTSAIPMFQNVPGALEHWPISISWHDWESEEVQSHASELCSSDALMVVISEIHADLEFDLQRVGSEGLAGFCQPNGFLGWCWPSAFLTMVQTHGLRRWVDLLGYSVECVLMYKPTHPDTLVAFAAESIADDIQKLGFTSSY